MNILIIEDEKRAALRLQNLISKIDSNIKVLGILDSIENSVKWLKKNNHPDLIFLDIQLSDGLCFEIFKQVEVNSLVIFTTAYNEYALKAFEINSIDYLLKPIDLNKLKLSFEKYYSFTNNFSENNINHDLNKIFSGLSTNSKLYKTRFLINLVDSLHVVTVDNIAYFYSEEKVTFIVTKDNEKFMINDSLEYIIKNTDPSLFFRINRQLIVSVNSISKINNYFNYKLKLELVPQNEKVNTVVSKSKVNDFKNWLSR